MKTAFPTFLVMMALIAGAKPTNAQHSDRILSRVVPPGELGFGADASMSMATKTSQIKPSDDGSGKWTGSSKSLLPEALDIMADITTKTDINQLLVLALDGIDDADSFLKSFAAGLDESSASNDGGHGRWGSQDGGHGIWENGALEHSS